MNQNFKDAFRSKKSIRNEILDGVNIRRDIDGKNLAARLSDVNGRLEKVDSIGSRVITIFNEIGRLFRLPITK